MPDANIFTDVDFMDTASSMVVAGSRCFLKLVADRSGPYYFYGQGFEVKVTRTDPTADYPGKSA